MVFLFKLLGQKTAWVGAKTNLNYFRDETTMIMIGILMQYKLTSLKQIMNIEVNTTVLVSILIQSSLLKGKKTK